MNILKNQKFKFASTLILTIGFVVICSLLPAVWANQKKLPDYFITTDTNKEYAKIYVMAFETGRVATVAAINANICAESYFRKGEQPGPECWRFKEEFEKHEREYEKMKKIAEASEKNGKNSK